MASNIKFNPIVWSYHTKQNDLKTLRQSALEERERLKAEVSRLQRDIQHLNNIIDERIIHTNHLNSNA